MYDNSTKLQLDQTTTQPQQVDQGPQDQTTTGPKDNSTKRELSQNQLDQKSHFAI
jgi:hypothetical protein